MHAKMSWIVSEHNPGVSLYPSIVYVFPVPCTVDTYIKITHYICVLASYCRPISKNSCVETLHDWFDEVAACLLVDLLIDRLAVKHALNRIIFTSS